MQKDIESIALIICTRNRPTYMRGLLQNLDSLTVIPGKILIIDSSDDDSTLHIIALPEVSVKERITYIKSLPGLPHQRNEGIKMNDMNGDYIKPDDQNTHLYISLDILF